MQWVLGSSIIETDNTRFSANLKLIPYVLEEKSSCTDNISLKLKVVALGETLTNGLYSLSSQERKRIVIKRETKKGTKLYSIMLTLHSYYNRLNNLDNSMNT